MVPARQANLGLISRLRCRLAHAILTEYIFWRAESVSHFAERIDGFRPILALEKGGGHEDEPPVDVDDRPFTCSPFVLRKSHKRQ